ncbi:MAG: hypothetical protein IKT09_06525 [Synergistes sp.]|nr:hypothetical protein [Synergistes sp.]
MIWSRVVSSIHKQSPLYLYNEGDECEARTGGWIVAKPVESYYSTDAFDKGADYLQCGDVDTSSAKCCGVITRNTFDLLSYSKLKIDYAYTDICTAGKNANPNYIGVARVAVTPCAVSYYPKTSASKTLTTTRKPYSNIVSDAEEYPTSTDVARRIFTVDLSAITQNRGYLRIITPMIWLRLRRKSSESTVSSSNGLTYVGKLRIYRVWAEV